MPLPARRHPVSARFPDLFDWLDSPWSAVLPFGPTQTFRVEDFTEDGKYMIRAELPGLDPEKDVEVNVESGMLTVHAERREETKENRHSEFKYGSLTRTVTLPEGADPDKITASYDQGILTVTVPVPERAKPAARKIAVGHAS
ncbi:MAG TPA: Hsp20/alpha crystallin family protein [Streptosporangiaceae bacterium]|nr:Hsp20/alpha crystallin family protein [Streptosporangiaceae bacterium]